MYIVYILDLYVIWVYTCYKLINTNMQINHITKETYTKNNLDILSDIQSSKSYKCNEWITYLQCKQVDRQVIKGEKGTKLVRVFFTDKNDTAGNEKKAIKTFTVFNIEQTKRN